MKFLEPAIKNHVEEQLIIGFLHEMQTEIIDTSLSVDIVQESEFASKEDLPIISALHWFYLL